MPVAEAERLRQRYGERQLERVPSRVLPRLLEAMAVLGELHYYGHDKNGHAVYSLPEDVED